MRNPFLFALLATGMVLGAVRADEAPSTAPAKPATTEPAPQTSTISRGSLTLTINAEGAFDPVDPFEVRLRPKLYQGELTILFAAANGKEVKKGEKLLELDPAPLKRLIAAAENDALAAHASLERAEADAKVSDDADVLVAKQQRDALAEAEQGQKWFETVDAPHMLKQLELNIEASKSQMEDEEDELDQLRKMYKSEELTNATADIVVKRAVRQLDVSKKIYSMTEERANKFKTFNFPFLKERTLESLEVAREQFALNQAAEKQGKVLRKTGLAAAHAAADAARLKLDDLKADLDKLAVRAPADGILCYGQIVNGSWNAFDPRTLRPGEHPGASAVLMTLYRPGRLHVIVDLSEAKYFAIKPGEKASISPVAFPELKYEALADAGPRTSSSGSYPLTLSMGEVDARLAPGMKAQVHMDVPLVDNALLAPTTAVKDGAIWVKTADKTESRHVLTGRTDGKSIELLSGVHEGDEVLTKGKE